MLSKSPQQLWLIQILFATGFALKGLCESNILYNSIPKGRKQGSVFATIDSKASSRFFIMDALASIISGFAFAVNGYIPLILTFITCIISTILSFKFKEINSEDEEKISLKQYMKELKEVVKFVKKSQRVKLLILIYAVFLGVSNVSATLRSGMLFDMKFEIMYSGILFAVLQFLAAMSSRASQKIHEKARNKTLSVLIIPFVVTAIFAGIVGNFTGIAALIFIIAMFTVQYMVKGPFLVLSTRYFTNFTNDRIRPNLYAIRNIFAYFISTILTFAGSMALKISSNANTSIIIGCIGTLVIVLTLDKMRDVVGLKIDQYSKNDLKYFEIEEEIQKN